MILTFLNKNYSLNINKVYFLSCKKLLNSIFQNTKIIVIDNILCELVHGLPYQPIEKMIKLNQELALRNIVDSVCSIVICKSLKPYIYEMSCFLYSGRYPLSFSKMNEMFQERKNKILKIYKKLDSKNKHLKMILIANKSFILFPLKQMFKSFINVKKIYIRTIPCQYIKKFKLSIFQYRYISISLVLNKIKANVNNTLKLKLYIYEYYISCIYLKYLLKSIKKNVNVIPL